MSAMTWILFIGLSVPDARRTGRKQSLVGPLTSVLSLGGAEPSPSSLLSIIIYFPATNVKHFAQVSQAVYSMELLADGGKTLAIKREHRQR